MATVTHYANFLTISILMIFLSNHSAAATANSSIPALLSPLLGNACQENVCGRGNCVVSNNSNFGFECECEAGWTQARSQNDDNLKFLPCVVPNCTLNTNCLNTAPSATAIERSNLSFFDPCSWTDCGGGRCNKISLFTHTCECEEGYYNLLNITAFPCYNQCALGDDCVDLGFGFTNTSNFHPNSNRNRGDNDNNSHSRLIPRIELAWFITMASTFVLVVGKNT